MCGKVILVILHGMGDNIPRWDNVPRKLRTGVGVGAPAAMHKRVLMKHSNTVGSEKRTLNQSNANTTSNEPRARS